MLISVIHVENTTVSLQDIVNEKTGAAIPSPPTPNLTTTAYVHRHIFADVGLSPMAFLDSPSERPANMAEL
jgi:hypothetical protein